MNFRPLYIFPILLLLGLTGAVRVVRAHRAAPLVVEAQARPVTDMEGIVFAAADRYGVPHDLARAVVAQESGGNPQSTSSVGAAGLMQVMPGTAAGIAAELGVTSYDIYDPQTNAEFGMYYLSGKIARYGVAWGLAAYNWGPAGVDSFLDRHPGMAWEDAVACCAGEIPEEARGYVRNILAMAGEPQSARARIVALALAQVGKSYVLGSAGPDTFDCSGLVHWVYAQQRIETGRVTQDQLRQLHPIEPSAIQAGDMVYFQFSWDQHTGILADVNGDGRWDMINAGTPQIGVVVTDNVFGDPFWTNAIIGYRSAL